MAHIDDVPEQVTDAGQDFNYTGPLLASVVLVTVPWDSTLQAIGVDKNAYDIFIDGEIAANRAWQNASVNIQDPRHPLILPMSFAQAASYNYARLNIDGHFWYLFITGIEYGSRGAIRFNTRIDPANSYGPWSLGYGMVKRGHVAIAVSQGDTYGDQYCDAPEPIQAPPERGVRSQAVLDSDPDNWTVLVISANDLRGYETATPYFELHTENDQIVNAVAYGSDASKDSAGVPQFETGAFGVLYPWQKPNPGPLEVYVPTVKAAVNSTIDGISAGGGVYLFTPAGFVAWLSIMQGASWVTEGISDIRLVPSWSVPGGGTGAGISDQPPKSATDADWNAAAAIPAYVSAVHSATYDVTVMAGWRETYLASVGGGMFRKLITSAHTTILVGNGESTQSYQPENMPSSGIPTHATTGAAHGEDTIRLAVDYNLMGDQIGTTVPIGGKPGTLTSGYGRAAAQTASADLGPVNSSYSNFMNRQVMTKNQALAVTLGVTKVPMNMGIIGVQSVMAAGQGAVMGGMVGSAPGAVAGAVLGGAASLVTAGISANNSLDLLDVSNNGSLDIGGYQLGAGGAFNVMSFRAWLQGLKAVSGRGQADRLASAWRAIRGQAFSVIIAAPAPSKVRALISMWKRYGYMINRAFKPSRLDVMTHYSYWQTEGAVIIGNMPQEEKERLAAAFDAGVTVWNQLDMVGSDQSAANSPVPGVYY